MLAFRIDNTKKRVVVCCRTEICIFFALGFRGGRGRGRSAYHYHYHYHSGDDGKSAFSVRGVVGQSVSSIEGLAREMATGEIRSITPLSEKVSTLLRHNDMFRCGSFKREHSVSTEGYA